MNNLCIFLSRSANLLTWHYFHFHLSLSRFQQLHSDVDKGDGKVKYVLSGEGATSIFTIDENTGDIHATKRLDREAQAYYTLQAQAVDRLTNLPVEPRSEFVVKVQDINDNEPKFLDGPYLAGVPEMSPLGASLFFCLYVFWLAHERRHCLWGVEKFIKEQWWCTKAEFPRFT